MLPKPLPCPPSERASSAASGDGKGLPLPTLVQYPRLFSALHYVLANSGGNGVAAEAERDARYARWGKRFGEFGAGVDGGATGAARTVGLSGSRRLTGYSIVSAGSLDAPVAVAKGCPVLEIGGAVDVYEAIATEQVRGCRIGEHRRGPERDSALLTIDRHVDDRAEVGRGGPVLGRRIAPSGGWQGLAEPRQLGGSNADGTPLPAEHADADPPGLSACQGRTC